MITATINTLSREERIAALMERDGPDCFLCKKEFKNGKVDMTFDHWIPQCKGGTWDLENLRLAHKKCNAQKGDLVPIDSVTVPKRVERDPFRSRAVKRSERPEMCQDCDNGRVLMPEESCDKCGGSPVPTRWPAYLHARFGECDHDTFWCGMCSLDIVPRKSALQSLIGM